MCDQRHLGMRWANGSDTIPAVASPTEADLAVAEGRILAYLANRVPVDDLHDLKQEALQRALAAVDVADFPAYAVACARKVHLEWLRKSSRELAHLIRDTHEAADGPLGELAAEQALALPGWKREAALPRGYDRTPQGFVFRGKYDGDHGAIHLPGVEVGPTDSRWLCAEDVAAVLGVHHLTAVLVEPDLYDPSCTGVCADLAAPGGLLDRIRKAYIVAFGYPAADAVWVNVARRLAEVIGRALDQETESSDPPTATAVLAEINEGWGPGWRDYFAPAGAWVTEGAVTELLQRAQLERASDGGTEGSATVWAVVREAVDRARAGEGLTKLPQRLGPK